jgi:hypothetical protein
VLVSAVQAPRLPALDPHCRHDNVGRWRLLSSPDGRLIPSYLPRPGGAFSWTATLQMSWLKR